MYICVHDLLLACEHCPLEFYLWTVDHWRLPVPTNLIEALPWRTCCVLRSNVDCFAEKTGHFVNIYTYLGTYHIYAHRAELSRLLVRSC